MYRHVQVYVCESVRESLGDGVFLGCLSVDSGRL